MWDLFDKKIINNSDVIFIEEQTIEYYDKKEKPKSDGISYANIIPNSPSENFDDGEDI